MRFRSFAAVVAAVCLYSISSVQGAELRILYAEPFRVDSPATGVQQKATRSSQLRFNAFGRSFDLELEDNSSLLRSASAAARNAPVAVLKGTVRDAPGSWVRLIVVDGRYEGAFWDGSDLYAIGASTSVQEASVTPFAQRSESAIYRLSDTQGGLLEGTCGLQAEAETASPLGRYRSMVGELRGLMQEKVTADREILVAMIADFEFASRYGTSTIAKLIDRANVADGIFSDQVGVSIVPTDFVVYTSSSDPFTSAEAGTLLSQLADVRSGDSTIRSRGLAHLTTGRELNGTIIGVAYTNSACEPRSGVSLSEHSGYVDSALVMAHELAHNLGASHDGEAGSACSATSPTYLMSPTFNSSSRLSACSVDSIKAALTQFACVEPRRNRDVAITFTPPSIDAVNGRPFDLALEVSSIGTFGAVDVTAQLHVPGWLTVQSASIAGGTCTAPSYDVTCSLAELPAGETRRLIATVVPNSVQQGDVNATVTALNDVDARNNLASARVSVAVARDMKITVQPQPLKVVLGEPFDVTFDVLSSGQLALNDVSAYFAMANGTIVSVSAEGGGVCTIAAGQGAFECVFNEIPAGATRRITTRLISTSPRGSNIAQLTVTLPASLGLSRSAELRYDTQPTRDLSVRFDPVFRRFATGVESEWNIVVSSTGAYSVTGSKLRIEPSIGGLPPVNLSVPTSCTPVGASFECDLGTVGPGVNVTLPIMLRVDQEVDNGGGINLRLIHAAADDIPWNDNDSGSFVVAPPIEIRTTGTAYFSPYDSQLSFLQEEVFAVGAYSVENGTAKVTLPASFQIHSAAANNIDCSIAASIATCQLPSIPAGNYVSVELRYTATMTGAFTGTLEVSAPGDADSSNNQRSLDFDVKPYTDGRLSVVEPPALNLTSVPLVIPFTAATNHHAYPNATFMLEWNGGPGTVNAAWPGGSCTGTSSPLRCELGDIPAHGSIPIAVTIRTTQTSYFNLYASLFSNVEVDYSNNRASFRVSMHQPVDLALRISPTLPTLTVGQNTQVVVIQVLGDAVGTFIELDLDPTLVKSFELSSAYCEKKTFPMRCSFHTSNSSPTDMRIYMTPAAVGTIPIKVKIEGFNDTTPGNNDGSFTLTVQAAPSPAPIMPAPAPPVTNGGTGGGGGGGAFDWMLLCFLFGLWVRCNAWRESRAQRRCSMTS